MTSRNHKQEKDLICVVCKGIFSRDKNHTCTCHIAKEPRPAVNSPHENGIEKARHGVTSASAYRKPDSADTFKSKTDEIIEESIARKMLLTYERFLNGHAQQRVQDTIREAIELARAEMKKEIEKDYVKKSDVIKMANKLTTKCQPLDFDRKPCKVDSDPMWGFIYCGGCDRCVIESGCICGWIKIEELAKLLGEKNES